MLGPVQADGSDSYVLGEINVSSVDIGWDSRSD
jgi:hypothetical protein